MAGLKNTLSVGVDQKAGLIVVERLEESVNDLGVQDGLVLNHYRTVVRTQDKFIRDALISLGWIPPDRQGG